MSRSSPCLSDSPWCLVTLSRPCRVRAWHAYDWDHRGSGELIAITTMTDHAPENGEAFDEVVSDFHTKIMPGGCSCSQHPQCSSTRHLIVHLSREQASPTG